MLEKRRQKLAETNRGSYYNQQEWVEEFLDDKGVFYNGSKSDDVDNDEISNENMEAVVHRCSLKQVFLKIRKFHRKTYVLEFLFNKFANPKASNFIKSRLQNRSSFYEICKLFKNTFFLQNTSGGCF